MRASGNWRWTMPSLLALVLALSTTGCQIDAGGQTLPSAWWQQDDVQYFPPGAEFKLAREAAALQALKRDRPQRSRANAQTPRPFPGAPAPADVMPPAPGPAAP